MKQELKENGGLPAHILWTLAIVAGVSVANLYYNQPLLNIMRHELEVSEFKTNLIAMITQIGYALGLLFIVPLGDLYRRKNIILTNFFLLIFSLLAIAMAPNIYIIWAASLITGICSMIPQIFVPIASQFSRPENKGRNVGVVISGLLTGILASRVVSGFVGEVLGWREMYFIAAGMMLLCAIVVLKVLPDIQPTFQGKYSGLMKSLFSLVREYPLSTNLLDTCRTGLWLIPCHVVLPCIQNGRSPVPCIQRCHRHTRALRHCRSLNRIFCRKICKKGRHTQFQLYRLRNDSACMGLALFLRKQLCRYHYRCHSYRHRHAMYPTQQPDQYFRHLPVCLQSGKYDFHDHLLHRRLFGYLPCRKQLADLGMEWRGRHRRYFNNNIVVHHPLQQEITRILSFFQANAKI